MSDHCRHCGSVSPFVEAPGKGPHHAQLLCADCGRHISWLPKPGGLKAMGINREDEIGGLWLKTSAAGKKFMSGRLKTGADVVEVVIFKNEFKKEGETTPDYRVYRSQPKTAPGAAPMRHGAAPSRSSVAAASRVQAHELDDEIPW